MLARANAALAALTCLLVAGAVRADDAHYQNFNPGARGAMLGGAYTAIADDSSGLYFNPAGIVDVRRANLSISTSLYGVERQLTFEDQPDARAWADELSARPVSGAEINIIPAAAGVALAFGRQLPSGAFPHGVAAGLVIPTYRGSVHRQELGAAPIEVTSLSRVSDRTMLFSGGYAYRVGPWLRLGGALHSAVRLVDTVEEFTFVDTSTAGGDPVFLSTTSNLSVTNASLAASLGAKLHPSRRWLIGLSVASPSLSVFQRGSFELRTARANFEPAADAPTALESSFDRVRWSGATLPLRARLGFAYVRPVDYTITLDVSLYAPTHYELVADRCQVDYVSEVTPLCALLQDGATDRTVSERVQRQSPIPIVVDRQPTANLNIGAEKLLRGDLSIGLGLFTDLSSAPDYQVDDDGNLTPDSTRVSNVDHFGATFSVGYFGAHSLSRIGLSGVFGTGQRARATNPGSRFIETADLKVRPVNTQEFMVYLFWSSTFRYGEGRTRLSDAEHSI